MCVCLCVSVERQGEKNRVRKRKEVEREKHEALSLRLHKTKSRVMSFSCVFVSLCVHLCTSVCGSARVLAVFPHCVLFTLPKETFTIMLLIGERKDTKRKRERGAGEMNRL